VVPFWRIPVAPVKHRAQAQGTRDTSPTAFNAAAASALERFFFLDDGDRALVG
jgi:hypothetical protein